MTRSHAEHRIQVAIVNTLRPCLPAGATLLSVPNQRATTARDVAREKEAGLRPGASDLIISWWDEGRRRPSIVAMEIKTERGRLSPSQSRFLAEVEANGWSVIVARSVEDAFRGLEAAGCPLRRVWRDGVLRAA